MEKCKNVGLTVNFTDQSTLNITAWSWTFGDGGTSTAQNPSHVYTTPGTYDVVLQVTSAGGTDTETKTSYITVDEPPPTADFVADVTSGAASLTVNFSDLSTGNITVWAWDFGDGNLSSDENPTHVYNTPGTYNVVLTVTSAGGSDSETKNGYITVTS